MKEFWELKFKTDGKIWGFEPSDSALLVKDFFYEKGIRKILIPGVGYGRNAATFYNSGFDVTGIEISETAINMAKENGMDFPIHYGSVIEMPFDNSVYEGVFCHAMLHLLNKYQRGKFLKDCYNQLVPGGYMIFTVISKKTELYGTGKYLSKDRYEVMKGARVFFYDNESIINEFRDFGLVGCQEIDEPIKFKEGASPMNLIFIKCKKGKDERK